MDGGSPLMVYGANSNRCWPRVLPVVIRPSCAGMSYGSPSLESAVDELLASDVDHIVVLPLYPQYSCSTVAQSGTNWAILARKRRISGTSFICYYAMTALYRCAGEKARVKVVRQTRRAGCASALLSRHSTANVMRMKAMTTRRCRCRDTTRESKFPHCRSPPEKAHDVFQSRFARTVATTPYTDETLKCWVKRDWPYSGHVSGICRGLSGDVLKR